MACLSPVCRILACQSAACALMCTNDLHMGFCVSESDTDLFACARRVSLMHDKVNSTELHQIKLSYLGLLCMSLHYAYL